MTTEGYKRSLAAIFSADIQGYSRLMGEDEAVKIQEELGEAGYEKSIFAINR